MRIAVAVMMVALVLGGALPLWAQEEAAPAAVGEEEGRPPVEVRGTLEIRPELKDVSGVRGWRVNGQVVTLEGVKDRALLFHGPYVLQDVVCKILLEQEAEFRGISVTYDEADAEVRALREQLGLVSEDALEFHLRQRRLTREGFREQAREYLLLTRVLADRVYVTDAEVQRFYDQFKDVLYSRGERVAYRIMSFNTEEAARAARQQLGRGRSFEEVAGDQARSAVERAVAGDLNWYERGQQPGFPPDFEAVLFAAPLNQVVGPIRVMDRYHLVRVEKKSDPYKLTLDEVRDDIRAQLRRQKLEQVVWPQWIGEQLASAKIEVLGAEAPSSPGSDADAGATAAPGQ